VKDDKDEKEMWKEFMQLESSEFNYDKISKLSREETLSFIDE
jgi:hypothetical protein